MKRWTQFVAVVVAWMLGLAQMAPVVQAHQYLRPRDTREGAATDIQEDRAWIFSAARLTPESAAVALPAEVRRPLYLEAHRAAQRGFEDRRAFTLWGPYVHENRQAQVAAYAKRYQQLTGKTLSADARKALLDQLTRVTDGVRALIEERVSDEEQRARLLEQTRFVAILAGEGLEPALATDGISGTPNHNALVSFGGGWDYRTQDEIKAAPEFKPRSTYWTVEQLDGLLARGEPGRAALLNKILHEDGDLVRGHHEDESPQTTASVNQEIAAVFEASRQARLDAVEKARAAQLNKTMKDFANVRLGPYLATAVIPDEAVAAAKAVLAQAKADGQIVASWVIGAGDDLQIQVNHHQGPKNPAVDRLIIEASTAALKAAGAKGVLKPSGEALLTASYGDRVKGLGLRTDVFPMAERGADPMIIVKAINGGAGTFNRALFRAFFHPDVHPAARLAREKFRGVVERIEDVRQGKKDRVRYEFGPGKYEEMLALIGDHTEWMLTEVYAATGRFAQTNPDEPVAKVIVEPIDAEGFTDTPANPTLVLRLQSGSEAVGVATDALATPWIAPGGANDAYHLTTIPVTWEQAKKAPGRGYINLVAYGYMSYGDDEKQGIHRGGTIPRDEEVIDLFNPRARADFGLLAKLWKDKEPELQVTFQLAQEKAHTIADFMMGHGEMDPFLTARGADALGEKTARSVDDLWTPIPKTELSVEEGGEVDEVVQRANARSKGRTLDWIKADAGAFGHLWPPQYFSAAAEASLAIMQADALIHDYGHFSEGDDYETLSLHSRGVDDHLIHLNSYNIFWRMVYLTDNYELIEGPDGRKVVKGKTYGKGQDLVSDATRRIPVPQLAGLNDRAIEWMARMLRVAGKEDHARALEGGYDIYKADVAAGKQIATAEKPFSGNITGQGPGQAGFPIAAEGPVRLALVASDKTGPAAFNLPILWMLEEVLKRGVIQKRGGAIAVIDDTKGHKRVFLDVETQMDLIRGLAANPDRYNFKRVISKEKPGWDRANWREYVGDQFFISTSTEKLSIITGGEYRGKDDSVLIADEDFGRLYFEHARDHVYFTQGDGFGSHNMHPRPEVLPTAIATFQSRGVQTGLWVDISADNKMTFTEAFDEAGFREARRRSEQITQLLWQVQGSEFTPVGVGHARVEQAYPLERTIREVTAPDSEHAVPVHVDVGQSVIQGELAGQFQHVSHQMSGAVHRISHDTAASKAVWLHGPSFFGQASDGAIAIERYLSGLGFSSLQEAVDSNAVRLVVADPEATDDAAAKKYLEDALKIANARDGGAATQLKPEWFTITRQAPSEEVALAIGPSTWLQGTRAVVKVALNPPGGGEAGKVGSAAAAFNFGLEAVASAATGKGVPPTLARKFDLEPDGDLFVVTMRDVADEVQTGVRAYQNKMRAIEAGRERA